VSIVLILTIPPTIPGVTIMAFMLPDIEYGDWIEVDGNYGTDFIPPGLVVLPDEADFEGDDGFDEDAYLEACAAVVADYVESTEIYSVAVRTGYGVRLSASGYMDCTAWSVFDTEAECRDHLAEFWEVCPDCGEPTDCEDCECHADCDDGWELAQYDDDAEYPLQWVWANDDGREVGPFPTESAAWEGAPDGIVRPGHPAR
jgi:hypothetical protein